MIEKFGEVEYNASLEKYNTYGIKTSTKYLIKVDSELHLKELIAYLNSNNMKYLVLGKGSNVILPDTPFDGAIISLEHLNNIEINDNIVKAYCGVSLFTLGRKTIDLSLEGLEYFMSIPGTLGGALYGNAGVKDHEIYDVVENVLVLRNNELVLLNRPDIEVSYRHTEFKNTNDIIIMATFNLKRGNKEKLENIVKEEREKRMKNQPLKYKNAGSVFKNPTPYFAGKLIEDCNLKGKRVGGACISEKHANFIINDGNATSSDIKKLIDIVKNEVYNKFKIKLELEQIIVKWD